MRIPRPQTEFAPHPRGADKGTPDTGPGVALDSPWSGTFRVGRDGGGSRLFGRLGHSEEAVMAETSRIVDSATVLSGEIVCMDDPVEVTERVAVAAFIAGYSDPTRRSYATDLRIFSSWCHDHGVGLFDVQRAHLELFARWMEQQGRMPSTIGRRLSTLSSFYRYCQLEDILAKNPALNVRRPKIHHESRTLGLDRNELGALLVQAGLGDLRDGALITLLALNGLRVSEALNADIDDLSTERGHRTLSIVRKGGKRVIVPLAPRTGRALDLYIADRTSGPIFLGLEGGRMDRYCADRMVKRRARRAGITKRISPHSLRHSFITAALDAGVPLRDVQEAASHADPRTTMRYDRARQSLDRHATYIVATFVAGASRTS